jgi:glycosyltransferase involved in cell wall biosynthesis
MPVKSLSLISAGYPPDLDGIGDYTFFLAQALVARTDVAKPVTVYTRKGKHEDVDGVRVVPFFDFGRPSSIRDLVPLVAQDSPDWLVLQYNPFSWGARGFCPALPPTLRRIKSLPHGPKLAVMFHETTVPKWPWRFTMMYAWQWPILRAVARQADAILASTNRWIPEIAATGARPRAIVLPIGSNIPRSNVAKSDARGIAGITSDCFVFGLFGDMHISRPVDWISAAIRKAAHQRLRQIVLHVGPGGAEFQRDLALPNFRSLGVLSAESAADALRCMDCLLAPFTDGVSTRRGSVLAALNNGVPVATTRRKWTDNIMCAAPREVLLASPASNADQFASDATGWIGQISKGVSAECESFFDAHFGWDLVAEQLMRKIATT